MGRQTDRRLGIAAISVLGVLGTCPRPDVVTALANTGFALRPVSPFGLIRLQQVACPFILFSSLTVSQVWTWAPAYRVLSYIAFFRLRRKKKQKSED